MNNIDYLKAEINDLAEKRSAVFADFNAVYDAPIAENRDFTPDETARVTTLKAELDDLKATIDAKRARVADLERHAQDIAELPLFHIRKSAPVDADDVSRMGFREIDDAIARAVESRDIDAAHARRVMKRHRDLEDLEWARRLAFRSTDIYEQAWKKIVTGRELVLSAEERAALAVGTNTQGGYLVPTHLDPTLILTNTGSANALRAISRVVTLSRENVWHGVTTAGVTASWDAELAEVSDDSPGVDTAAVPTYMARAFVQASAEAIDDIEGIASDVLMLFADARDRLEGAAHCTGLGTTQPTGIFTAITGSQMVVSTTAATIGLVDIQAVHRSLGHAFRRNSTWVYAPVYGDAMKALGTAISASYSTNITQANTQTLLGRPVVETDDAPTTQTTTVKDPELILGDFRNFLIVDKPGSTSIEFIPHLFNTANNLPDGRRGWFMRFRSGSDSVNDAAFRLLADKTSA